MSLRNGALESGLGETTNCDLRIGQSRQLVAVKLSRILTIKCPLICCQIVFGAWVKTTGFCWRSFQVDQISGSSP